jgi:hypothetical protein
MDTCTLLLFRPLYTKCWRPSRSSPPGEIHQVIRIVLSQAKGQNILKISNPDPRLSPAHTTLRDGSPRRLLTNDRGGLWPRLIILLAEPYLRVLRVLRHQCTKRRPTVCLLGTRLYSQPIQESDRPRPALQVRPRQGRRQGEILLRLQEVPAQPGALLPAGASAQPPEGLPQGGSSQERDEVQCRMVEGEERAIKVVALLHLPQPR